MLLLFPLRYVSALPVLCVFALLTAAGGPACAAADTSSANKDLSDVFLTASNWLAAFVILAFVLCAALLRNALISKDWNIADALSEEADISLRDAQGRPITEDGKAVMGSELRASSSRFIAMFGLIAILCVYVGFGAVLVKRLASGQPLPSPEDFNQLRTFLFAGATLFAPYAVNKFSSVFDWLKPPGKS